MPNSTMIPIKVVCMLDLDRSESWPSLLPFRPMVGDDIISQYVWRNPNVGVDGVQLRLRVVSLTFRPNRDGIWLPEVELTYDHRQFKSMALFENWYAKTRGVIDMDTYRRRSQELENALRPKG